MVITEIISDINIQNIWKSNLINILSKEQSDEKRLKSFRKYISSNNEITFW